jgi:hypothetical protein
MRVTAAAFYMDTLEARITQDALSAQHQSLQSILS